MKPPPYPEPSSIARFSRGSPARPFPNELLVTVSDAERELTTSGEIAERLTRALRVLERRLGAARSVLYLLDAERRTLSVEASCGSSRDQFRPRYGAGVAGRVAQSGQPAVVPTVCHDPSALSELTDLSRWSDLGWNLMAVPVTDRGRQVAVLCVYFYDRDPAVQAERLAILGAVGPLMWKAVHATRTRRSVPSEHPMSANAILSRPIDTQSNRANAMQERDLSTLLQLPAPLAPRPTLSQAVARLERQMIEEALRSERGNVGATARVLGTSERVVRYKARKLGIDPARFRA